MAEVAGNCGGRAMLLLLLLLMLLLPLLLLLPCVVQCAADVGLWWGNSHSTSRIRI
jgi:hypothetical protein